MLFGKKGMTILLVATLATASLVLVSPLLLRAQTGPAVANYTATVVNHSKGEIYYKIVGGKGKVFSDGTLQPNLQLSHAVSGGDKVVCIWDDGGSLLAAWRLSITGNCTITVPDLSASKEPNYTMPGKGVVNMERDSQFDIKSPGPPPMIERKPN